MAHAQIEVYDTLVLQDPPVGHLRHGDSLLCRGGRGLSRDLIVLSSRGPYYHAAVYYRDYGRDMVVEMVESAGGRVLPLDQWIAQRDGRVDVFRATSRRFNPIGMSEWMRNHVVGRVYSWSTIRRFSRQESWLTCWWNRPCYDEDAPCPTEFVCSTAAAAACKYGGGQHPVPALWVGDVRPTDYARSPIHRYQFSFDGGLRAAGGGA